MTHNRRRSVATCTTKPAVSVTFGLETGMTYAHYDADQLILMVFWRWIRFLGNIGIDKIKADNWTLDLTGRYNFDHVGKSISTYPLFTIHLLFIRCWQLDKSDLQSRRRDPTLGGMNAGSPISFLMKPANTPDQMFLALKAPTGKEPYQHQVHTSGRNDNLRHLKVSNHGNGVSSLTRASL
ncbi:hypothetical protein ACVBEG_27685 [Pseudomonas sp. GG8]